MLALYSALTYCSTTSPETTLRFTTLKVWSAPRLYVLGRWNESSLQIEWLTTNTNASLVQDLSMLKGCRPTSLTSASGSAIETLVADQKWILVETHADLRPIKLRLSFDPGCEAEVNLRFENATKRRGRRLLSLEPRLLFSATEQTLAGQNIRVREHLISAQLLYSLEARLPYRIYSLGDTTLQGGAIEALANAMSRRWWRLGIELELSQSMRVFPTDLSDAMWSLSLFRAFFFPVADGLSITPHVGARKRLLLDDSLLLPDAYRRLQWFFLKTEAELQFAGRWMLRPSFDLSMLPRGAISSHTQSLELALVAGYRVSPSVRIIYEASILNINAKEGGWKFRQLTPLVLGAQLEF